MKNLIGVFWRFARMELFCSIANGQQMPLPMTKRWARSDMVQMKMPISSAWHYIMPPRPSILWSLGAGPLVMSLVSTFNTLAQLCCI